MVRPTTPTAKRAARRRTSRLLAMMWILLSLALTLSAPASAAAFVSTGDGGWFKQSPATTASIEGVAFPDATHGWAVGWDYDTSSNVILATTDGGATWFKQSSGTSTYFCAIAFPDVNHGWAVGPGARVFATSNGGATWAAQDSAIGVSLYDVAFIDASHGWAVGEWATILDTSNGGASWRRQPLLLGSGNFVLSGVDFPDATHGCAVGYDIRVDVGGGLIFSTSDGGITWKRTSWWDMPETTCLRDVAFPDAIHGWAVGDKGTIIATSDGGVTWETQNTWMMGRNWLKGVAFADATHGWAVGDCGTIFATTDGGATWKSQNGWNPDIILYSVAFTDATHGWAVGYDRRVRAGIVLATTTGGVPLPTPPPTPAPKVTSFTPTSGPVGTVVTLAGTAFTGAAAVAFHGTAAATFNVVSATQITAAVPAGATTGTIAVTTPGGTGTSATSFTVVVTPKVTLKLSGLTNGAIKLGRRVTAKGVVTPTSLAGSKVKLKVQKKRGARWVTLRSTKRTISATGAYSWKYKPAKKGAYRMRATIAKTTATAAAKTPWRKFKVK